MRRAPESRWRGRQNRPTRGVGPNSVACSAAATAAHAVAEKEEAVASVEEALQVEGVLVDAVAVRLAMLVGVA